MISNIQKYEGELGALLKLGNEEMNKEFADALIKRKSAENINVPKFSGYYQNWYSESREVIRQLLPGRLSEFESLYNRDVKRKVMDVSTYSIQDWLLGVQANINGRTGEKYFDDAGTTFMRFQSQLLILQSVQRRFKSSLFDIKQLVQADLFDSELEAAKELNKKGFARGAGAVAGVVLERHLYQVCENHQVKIAKKNPGINDLGQLLKDSAIIETKDWRFIQHLADLRNLCDHNKETEPKKEDVGDLIEGVEKVSKTIF